MKRYLVTITLQATVEAETEDEAVGLAPPVPAAEGWYPVGVDPFQVEEV